jgi:SNF2 family DNA or RNA helicase
MAPRVAQIEIEGNRIILWTPWVPTTEEFEANLEKCKQVQGGTFRRPTKTWSYPLTWGTCTELREAWGPTLKVGTDLSKWAWAERNRRAEVGAIAKLDSAELPRVAELFPRLAEAMYARKYQPVGARWLTHNRHGALADQPGLGKTLQSAAAVIESGLDGPVLVIAPAPAVTMTWKPELEHWLPGDQVWAVSGDRATREHMIKECLAAEGRRWLVVNPDMFEVPHDVDKNVTLHVGKHVLMPVDGVVTEVFVRKGDPVHPHMALFTVTTKKSIVTVHNTSDSGYQLLDLTVSAGTFVYAASPVMVLGKPDAKKMDTKSKISIIRDMLYHDLLDHCWAHVVVDESHKMLITTTGIKSKQPWKRQGLGQVKVADGGMRIAMSGTPFRGKITNWWGTLNWLIPERYTAYWKWVERWFDVFLDEHGFRVIGNVKANLQTEFEEELDSMMLRRTKSEVAPDLQPKTYAGRRLRGQQQGPAGIWLEMTPEQRKAYGQMRKDSAAAVKGGTLIGDGLLSSMTRLRQFSSCMCRLLPDGSVQPLLPSNKFDWILNWLDERDMIGSPQPGVSKVIIASQFSQVLDLFQKELLERHQTPSLKITGSVSTGKREAAKKLFQSDDPTSPKIMLLTTTAGGVSLTLDAADDVIFIDETWIPDDQEQVEDRIHRVSRVHRATMWYLRSLGSIEHYVAMSNHSAEEIQKRMLDGRRGVEFALNLITEMQALMEAA